MPRHFVEAIFEPLRALLPEFDVSDIMSSADPDAVVAKLRRSHYVIWTEARIPDAVVASVSDLRLIQKWGAGVDGLDVAAAERIGLTIANVPGGNAISVAEHFFALVLSLLRHVSKSSSALAEGQWLQAELVRTGIEDIHGKTLGLIGCGAVGRAIATRACAFGMRVIYFTRTRLPIGDEERLGASFVDLPHLLSNSDVVGVAVPLTAETNRLIDAKAIGRMKASAVIVNVARGGVVDHDALYDALTAGRLAGAALDVFRVEPPTFPDALLRLSNVVATPHIGGRSRQAIEHITNECAANIRRAASGEGVRNLVRLT
jgi:D-3-phosphoglycerate dehydrogenase / 2-oxoglutarate reductase